MKLRYLCTVATVLIVSGCSIFRSDSPDIFAPIYQAVLDENRGKWKSSGIVHYRMTIRAECHSCTWQNLRWVEVRRGKVADAVYAHGGPVPPDRLANVPTVDVLFGKIQAAIDAWGKFHVRPEYDRELGYPTYTGIRSKFVMDIDRNYFVTISSSNRRGASASMERRIVPRAPRRQKLWGGAH